MAYHAQLRCMHMVVVASTKWALHATSAAHLLVMGIHTATASSAAVTMVGEHCTSAAAANWLCGRSPQACSELQPRCIMACMDAWCIGNDVIQRGS
jgi:hypothetical protein